MVAYSNDVVPAGGKQYLQWACGTCVARYEEDQGRAKIMSLILQATGDGFTYEAAAWHSE